MTSTTPQRGLPYPENTDPVTLGADAIRDLALGLDPMIGAKFVGDSWSGVANNDSNIGIPMAAYLRVWGPGTVFPVSVINGDPTGTGTWQPIVIGFDNTQIVCNCPGRANTPVRINWCALLRDFVTPTTHPAPVEETTP